MTPENFSLANNQWSFIPPEKSSYRDYINQTFPVMLRITDYNLDGYPDAIVVLSNASATGYVMLLWQVSVCYMPWGGGGYSVCQGICTGSAGKTPLFQPPWYDKRPPFSAWSDL